MEGLAQFLSDLLAQFPREDLLGNWRRVKKLMEYRDWLEFEKTKLVILVKTVDMILFFPILRNLSRKK